jgi:hypothetical protein
VWCAVLCCVSCAVVCCGVLWCAVVCCGVVCCGVLWCAVVQVRMSMQQGGVVINCVGHGVVCGASVMRRVAHRDLVKCVVKRCGGGVVVCRGAAAMRRVVCGGVVSCGVMGGAMWCGWV